MKKFFVCCFLIAVFVVPLLIITGNTNNERPNLNQKSTYVYQEYKANQNQEQMQTAPRRQESMYDFYQAYKTKHKRDKELFELLDLYNYRFNPNFSFRAYKDDMSIQCEGRDLDIFCSQNLWNSYGIYTNIHRDDKDCFCQCDSNYKTDKCVLTRRKAVDADIGFFDYKFFLPDELKMSKGRFIQIAEKYRIAEALKKVKCLDDKLELLSTEREACVKRVEDYIKNLGYNKIQPCKKKYNPGTKTVADTIDPQKARYQYIALSRNISDPSDNYYPDGKAIRLKNELLKLLTQVGDAQLKKMQFEIDNNCVLKE